MIRFITRSLMILSFLIVCAFAGGVGVFYYFGRALPNYQQLETYEPPVVTRLYAGNGQMFAEYAAQKRLYVPIKAIPKQVIDAFIAAEDKNFYTHGGIDFLSILSAALTNLGRLGGSKRPIGASTITQQVAKNFLLTDIAHTVSYERKIKEAILSLRIEQAYSKDHILELYLNEIYLGAGVYGVAAAALHYFDKGLGDLTLAESAFLAGLPKAPSHYHPKQNPSGAKWRRDYVISRLRDDGVISDAAAAAAKDGPVVLHERGAGNWVEADYFAEEVRRELAEKFGEKTLYQGGLCVRTSLDPAYQMMAEKALKDGLIRYDRRHGFRGPLTHVTDGARDPALALKNIAKPAGAGHWMMAIVMGGAAKGIQIGTADGARGSLSAADRGWAPHLKTGDVILVSPPKTPGSSVYGLEQIPAVSGAIVVMDPHQGRVLALHGGFSFQSSQFNRATQAKRQMGSVFKTFVYLSAFEKGLTPSTIVQDIPFSIQMGHGLGVWAPHNYDNTFSGPITLRRAFERSRNAASVRMIYEKVGMKTVCDVTARLGIVDPLPRQLAMVLGAAESTLLKVTSAYAMIAGGGRRLTPTLLDRVQDRHGRNVLVGDGRTCVGCHGSLVYQGEAPILDDRREQVIDPVSAYQTTSLLEGVVERGTGGALKTLNHPIAGKTGTTNDFRDAWFVGFTPDLVVGVYVGFDQPKGMGEHENGARLALPIFSDFMKDVLKDKPAIPFRIPRGVKLVRVNADTGLKSSIGQGNTIFEAFRSGTESAAEFRDGDEFAPGFDVPSVPSLGEKSQEQKTSSLSGTGGLY